MKKFKFTIQGNKYDVNILNVEDNLAEVEVNGAVYTVEVDKVIAQTKTPKLVRPTVVPSTESAKSEHRTSAPSEPKGTGLVRSPLPGVILSINVKEGDAVKVGTKLLMLEAMKMENNINADKEGIIKSINVRTGDSVLEGDVLLEIGD